MFRCLSSYLKSCHSSRCNNRQKRCSSPYSLGVVSMVLGIQNYDKIHYYHCPHSKSLNNWKNQIQTQSNIHNNKYNQIIGLDGHCFSRLITNNEHCHNAESVSNSKHNISSEREDSGSETCSNNHIYHNNSNTKQFPVTMCNESPAFNSSFHPDPLLIRQIFTTQQLFAFPLNLSRSCNQHSINTHTQNTSPSAALSVDIIVDNHYYMGAINHSGFQSEFGFMSYSNGDRFEGQCLNGFPHDPSGVYYYASVNGIYSGSFIHGKREGFGIYININTNERYEGYWVNNNRSGEGQYFINDLLFYSGEFAHNQYHGSGTVYYPHTTESWMGTFSNGSMVKGIRQFNHMKFAEEYDINTGKLNHWKKLESENYSQNAENLINMNTNHTEQDIICIDSAPNQQFNELLGEVKILQKSLNSKLQQLNLFISLNSHQPVSASAEASTSF